MDDNAKQVSSYQLDQEILDARGINMTVEEVATLPTCRYAERVASLRLDAHDLALLKGLRRRIKNRLASQNSRRRSMEHLRRLTRELRTVRQRRNDVLSERRTLTAQRDHARVKCHTLRAHIAQVLLSRSDPTEVPSIDQARITESQPKELPKKVVVTETKTPLLAECFLDNKIDRDKPIFECRIDKIVQNSVNHMYNKNEKDMKKIFAKTVFISNDKHPNIKSLLMNNVSSSDDDKSMDTKVFAKTVFISNEKPYINQSISEGEKSIDGFEENGVLNLSVKAEKRRSHGRKQSAPRRIPYACMEVMEKIENDDIGVLDLKIKKEPQ
ncbi:hypothetical protein NE865_10087 [Phthorimaea operculella]|nr:hypothetical protein NE865_10087 [Phthorimaea operculella]